MKPTTRPISSREQILGKSHAPKPRVRPEPHTCLACQQPLASIRVEALRALATPYDGWTCFKCSDLVTTPRLGIFMGEVGTSEMKIVDRIYDDSVRDIFMESDSKEEQA